ncbi:MAG: hypothetical protein U0802_21945 [Candidatus Binatia bacterium]
MPISRSLLLAPSAAYLLGAAAPARPTPIATVGGVVAVRGTAEVNRGGGGGSPHPAHPVFNGQQVRTDAGGAPTLVFSDDCVVIVGPATTLTVDHYGGKAPRQALLRLEVAPRGHRQRLWRRHRRFEVETSAVVRVQGTRFIVQPTRRPRRPTSPASTARWPSRAAPA